MTEKLVRTPVFGQLDGRPPDIPMVLLELGLETAEQREGIGGGTGKSGQDFLLIESADLLGGMLNHPFAKGHLAIASKNDAAIAAHTKNCSRADQALRRH